MPLSFRTLHSDPYRPGNGPIVPPWIQPLRSNLLTFRRYWSWVSLLTISLLIGLATLPSVDLLPTVQLLTIGPLAQAIATHTAVIGAAWLSLPPTVHQVAIGADGEQPWALAANGGAKSNGLFAWR